MSREAGRRERPTYKDVRVSREAGRRTGMCQCRGRRKRKSGGREQLSRERLRRGFWVRDGRYPAYVINGKGLLAARQSKYNNPQISQIDVQATHRDVGRYDSTDGGGRIAPGAAIESNTQEQLPRARLVRGQRREQGPRAASGTSDRAVVGMRDWPAGSADF